MPKPDRKGSHKGRILCLTQNKTDFESQTIHQEKAHESLKEGGLGVSNSIMEKSFGKVVKEKHPDKKDRLEISKG
jgi:hypothetical protein